MRSKLFVLSTGPCRQDCRLVRCRFDLRQCRRTLEEVDLCFVSIVDVMVEIE